ncbi:hypothetical protein K466DRAFT_130696 [Polyporus arcularius HHB13444]|uniref:Uncharacterized protein n=1 Tax=Polyporus arcularius HHB13444 TaxID=1314778 RepID=A0A5C3PX53_9APHY|nr:hypothetical protein K466DRAFT_130696 [Polyporus arcularius HHB13444]
MRRPGATVALEFMRWDAIERIVTSHPRASQALDRNIAVTAYTATSGDLAKAPIFYADLGHEQVPGYCRDIWNALQTTHWRIQYWGHSSQPILTAFQHVLISALRFMLSTDISSRDDGWVGGVLSLLDIWCCMPAVPPDDDCVCVETMLSIITETRSAKLANCAFKGILRVLCSADHLDHSPRIVYTALAAADEWITRDGTADGGSESDRDVCLHAAEIVAHYILHPTSADLHPSPGPTQHAATPAGGTTLEKFWVILNRWKTSEPPLLDQFHCGDPTLCNSLAVVLFALKRIGLSIDSLEANGLPPRVEEALKGLENRGRSRESTPLAGWVAHERESITRNARFAFYSEASLARQSMSVKSFLLV